MTPTPPRVVVASRLFVPEVSAGAFRLGALSSALARNGARTTVLTSAPPGHASKSRDPEGVAVHRLPVLRDRGGNVRGYVQYASFDVPLAARLLRHPADVYVAESPPTTALVTAALARLRRKPLVYYAADVWTDGVVAMGAADAVVAAMRSMERRALRAAAITLSVSEEVSERLRILGAPPERIVTVGNGIDTSIFRPEGDVEQGRGRYFVYTGTMSEWQRPEIFLDGFALIADRFPDVELRFFGQGSLEAGLRERAERELPGRVRFGGVVTPTQSAEWIRGAQAALVSIFPGIGYDFARPTKTYAAAACGTPVIFAGARTGGEVVRDASLGVAVEFDGAAVAEAMVRILDDPKGRDDMRNARAEWARMHVSLDAVGDRAASAVLGAFRGTASHRN